MRRITTTVSGRPMVAWNLPGRKPSVVCVHGAGVSSRELLPFMQVLGPRHDAQTVDLPGFGASGGPPYPPDLHALAETLAECLTILDLERVVLRGGSFFPEREAP
ncbi:alpha/beta hydrolase [Streptomyces cyaneofuscatus]|uniref:alpha/beta fold hydrolase n=1 Tax=Streptomyces cyaneofuscatus TaxID=66883 RepID=UPI00344FCB80